VLGMLQDYSLGWIKRAVLPYADLERETR